LNFEEKRDRYSRWSTRRRNINYRALSNLYLHYVIGNELVEELFRK